MDLAGDIARQAGLQHPRITSDGKYVEIGLTDKGDSVVWLLENVARPKASPTRASSSPATNSATWAASPAAIARMLVPEAEDAVFVLRRPGAGGSAGSRSSTSAADRRDSWRFWSGS